MIKLTFDIPPVAQARPRARHIPAKMVRTVTSMGIRTQRRKGKTYLYDRKDVKIFKGQLGMLARNQYKGEPLEGPLMVSLHFYRPSAKVSKKELARRYSGQEPPVVKPDLDNYIKSTLDGLTGIIWKDDNCIVKFYDTFKDYSDHPRIELEVKRWVNA